MLDAWSPARLKVLLGAVQTIACLARWGLASRKMVWGWSGKAKSQWISSETTNTPYRWHTPPSRRSSSAVQTLPTGLWGLHRKNIFTWFSAIFRSKSAKSIS